MPRNSSGTYSLPEAAFVSGTVISSTAVNSDFSDIGTSLTDSLSRTGLGGMQAVLALDPTGFVYGNDLNTGMYRTAADAQAVKCGGSDIMGFGLTAITAYEPIVAIAGTVAAPGISFTGELDCGLYLIGTNNIGVSVNGTKIIDVKTTGADIVGNSSISGNASIGGNASVTGNATVTGSLTANSISAATPTSFTVQRFTSGSGTYSTPANVKRIVVTMIAGGGGGGAVSTNNGTAGGTTSFESWTAIGGNAGSAGASNGGSGGTGGASGTGTLITRAPGGAGGPSINGVMVGTGAASPFGGAGAATGTAGGSAVANSGSGGAGGTAASVSGSGGGAGEYVKFSIASPSATYSYAVGAKGTGGAAGSQAGGDGGSGLIIVEEYYL